MSGYPQGTSISTWNFDKREGVTVEGVLHAVNSPYPVRSLPEQYSHPHGHHHTPSGISYQTTHDIDSAHRRHGSKRHGQRHNSSIAVETVSGSSSLSGSARRNVRTFSGNSVKSTTPHPDRRDSSGPSYPPRPNSDVLMDGTYDGLLPAPNSEPKSSGAWFIGPKMLWSIFHTKQPQPELLPSKEWHPDLGSESSYRPLRTVNAVHPSEHLQAKIDLATSKSQDGKAESKTQQPNATHSSAAKTHTKGSRSSVPPPLPERRTSNVVPGGIGVSKTSTFLDGMDFVQEPEPFTHQEQDKKERHKEELERSGQSRQEQKRPSITLDKEKGRANELPAQSMQDLKRENEDLKRQNEELRQAVFSSIDENQGLRDLLTEKAASENLTKGAGATGGHMQDSDIYQRWKQLGWYIRQCAHLANEVTNNSTQNNGEGSASASRSSRKTEASSSSKEKRSSTKKRSSRSRARHESADKQKGVSSQNKDILNAITPYYEAFLATDQSRTALAEATIWKILLAMNILTTSTRMSRMEWAGKYARSIRPLLTDCFAHCRTAREFHRWRCHTATFLASLPTCNSEVAAQASEPVVNTLEAILSLIFDIEDGGLGKELENIVLNAFQLDKELCQQQALWYCDDPSAPAVAVHVGGGSAAGAGESGERSDSDEASPRGLTLRSSKEVRFDDRLMEVASASGKDVGKNVMVTLVISPALVKAGNSYGENYEVSLVKGKCEVVITKKPMKTAGSK